MRFIGSRSKIIELTADPPPRYFHGNSSTPHLQIKSLFVQHDFGGGGCRGSTVAVTAPCRRRLTIFRRTANGLVSFDQRLAVSLSHPYILTFLYSHSARVEFSIIFPRAAVSQTTFCRTFQYMLYERNHTRVIIIAHRFSTLAESKPYCIILSLVLVLFV